MKLLGDARLFEDLKERRFAQFFAIYCVVGWTVLRVFDQLADREVLPELVYRVVLTLVLFGAPGAVIVTWFHGEKGHQKMPRREKWLLAGVAALALTASGLVIRSGLASAEAGFAAGPEPWEDPTRVAVLYFDSRASAGDAEFIAAGLTEGLIDELSAVDALHVISRNGSQLYRGAPAPDDSIARALGVGTIVRGQVAVAGEQVRLTVSVVEGGTGRQLDSRRIEAARADLFELQDELAAQVSVFLRERIGSEVRRHEARSSTRVVEAWELLQQAEQTAAGAEHLMAAGDVRRASAQLSAADSMLARVEALDPEWTHAVTRRGWLAYQQSRLLGMERTPQAEWTERGLEHAERARRRSPDDADALELEATLLYWRFLLNLARSHDEEHELLHRAEAGLREAVASNPRQASAWTSLSHLLMARGAVPQARLAALRSYEADPFLANAHLTLWRLASTSWELADRLESQRWCDEGLSRFPDDYRFRECQLKLFALPGQRPEAPAVWERLAEYVELSPPQLRDFNEKRGMMFAAMALVRAELPDSARAVAARGRATPQVDPLREVALMEAIVRSWLDEPDEAVRLLGLHLAANPAAVQAYRNGFESGEIYWYLSDLVGHPAFRQLIGVP